MIATAKPEMIPALSALWECCFGDEESYRNLFFSHCFDPNTTLVWLEEGQPVGMLHLLPLTLSWQGGSLAGRYVYAVGVLPPYRSKGIATALLKGAEGWTMGRGEQFLALIPAQPSLFAYYGHLGFATAFTQECPSITGPAPQGFAAKTMALSSLQVLRRQAYLPQGVFTDWGERHLAYALQETAHLGGGLLRFAGGYALYLPVGEMLLIKELVSQVYAPMQAAAGVMAALGFTKGQVQLPGQGKEYAMLRYLGGQALPNMPGFFTLGLD